MDKQSGEQFDWADRPEFWLTTQDFEYDKARIDATPGEVEHVIQLLDVRPASRVLDIGCGFGRHSLELARRGYQVVGIDRTEGFIDQALRAASRDGLQVEFLTADARTYCRRAAFDATISLFTSFGYYDADEDGRILRNVALSLVPGGRFLLDTVNSSIFSGGQHLQSEKTIRGRTLTESSDVTLDGKYLDSVWTISSDGSSPRVLRSRLRLYKPRELEAMLTQSGFVETATYGSLDAVPYSPSAMRTVIVASTSVG